MKKNDGALIKRDINAEIIKAAKHLFSEVGFKKTTVADIAHELGMSQTNVYRFFKSKAEINAAVCGQLFSEIEAASEEIARDSGPASKTLRNLIASVERLNSLRFHDDRKLHELLQTAYDENWLIVREHCKRWTRFWRVSFVREWRPASFEPVMRSLRQFSSAPAACAPG